MDIQLPSDYMLTTYDNPISPFQNFEGWFKEDHRLKHNTCELLASLANVVSIASEEVQREQIDAATKEIVRRYPTIYKVVTE